MKTRLLHRIEYRLASVLNGERVVGYNNECGKGNHRHFRGTVMRYTFKDVPAPLRDFLRDVKEAQS